MNDITKFRQLIKAVYPSFNVSVTIELLEDGFKISVASYKAKLTGTLLYNNEVEVSADSAENVVLALKPAVAKSRREKAARGVLSECIRRSGGLDESQQSDILRLLRACQYHNYETLAARCITRAVAIGNAAREALNQEMAHS